MATFSTQNVLIENNLKFSSGATAGYVLQINADGSTSWVSHNSGGGGGGGGGGNTIPIDLSMDGPTFNEGGSMTFSATSSTYSISNFSWYVSDGGIYTQANTVSAINKVVLSNMTRGTYSLTVVGSNATMSGIATMSFNINGTASGYIFTSMGAVQQDRYNLNTNTRIEVGNTSVDKYSISNYSLCGINIYSGEKVKRLNPTTGYSVGFAISTTGSMYIGTNTGNISVFDSNHNFITSYTPSANIVYDIVCGATAIYACSGSTNNIFKIDPGTGTILWTANHGSTVYSMCVDSSDNLYIHGVRTGNITTRKYNSAGSVQWSMDCGGSAISPGGITTDGTYLYVAHTRNSVIAASNASARIINCSDGTIATSIDTSQNGFGAAHDSSGNIYITGGTTTKLRKYNSAGVFQWSSTASVVYRSVYVDTNDTIWAFCDTYNSGNVMNFTSGGTAINNSETAPYRVVGNFTSGMSAQKIKGNI